MGLCAEIDDQYLLLEYVHWWKELCHLLKGAHPGMLYSVPFQNSCNEEQLAHTGHSVT